MTRPAGMRRLTGSDRRARPPAATPDALLLTRARGPARQPLVSIPPQRSAMPWRVRGLGWAASCRRHRMVACGNRQRGSRCPAAGGGPGWRFRRTGSAPLFRGAFLGWAASCWCRMPAIGNRQRGSRHPAAGGGPG